MNSRQWYRMLTIFMAILLCIQPALTVLGQGDDDDADPSFEKEELPYILENMALASEGATATASSTSGTAQSSGLYSPQAILDGDRRGQNWGSWSTAGGWRDATADTYPDWIEIRFDQSKEISEVDVFTLQDNYTSAVDPTLDMTFTKFGVTTFQVQYWNGSSWVTVASKAGNNCVWSKFKFGTVRTDKIRINITGALAGYSRLTEVEAWGVNSIKSIWLPDGLGNCAGKNPPEICELISDLHDAMMGTTPQYQNWEARLDWSYTSWKDSSDGGTHRYGSLNLPLLAHAIALFRTPSFNYSGQDRIGWWMSFLDCQTGEICPVNDPQSLQFFGGTEMFSNTYDKVSILAVAAVRQYAVRQLLQGENARVRSLGDKARGYMRLMWSLYALSSGSGPAWTKIDRFEPGPQNCQAKNNVLKYNGPFVTMAGMRSVHVHQCLDDDRHVRFARAIDWGDTWFLGEDLYKGFYEYLESQPQKNDRGTTDPSDDIEPYPLESVYALRPEHRELLRRHVLMGSELATLLSFIAKVNTFVPYHIIALKNTGGQARVTVMETNRNRNTSAVYAEKFEFVNQKGRAQILFPWSNKDPGRCNVAKAGDRPWRLGISFGYAELLPGPFNNPTSIIASNEPKGASEANCYHEDHKPIIDKMSIPTGTRLYHIYIPDKRGTAACDLLVDRSCHPLSQPQP